MGNNMEEETKQATTSLNEEMAKVDSGLFILGEDLFGRITKEQKKEFDIIMPSSHSMYVEAVKKIMKSYGAKVSVKTILMVEFEEVKDAQ